MQIYGCTDPSVIKSLQSASSKGLKVKVFYDPSGSGNLRKKIKNAIPLNRRGLMHKKILIIDEEQIFIGTANFTPTSLCMHDNVILGLHDKQLAHDLQHSTEQKLHAVIGKQTVDFWHLPDFKQDCLKSVLKLLSSAQKSIKIALFTFSHPSILEALQSAKERGVEVLVALDHHMVKGAGQKAVEFLHKSGIPLYTGKGGKLLHHKWCLIDEKSLILGSANWTKSAFRINEDCLLVIHPLTEEQKGKFRRIWKQIEASCKTK